MTPLYVTMTGTVPEPIATSLAEGEKVNFVPAEISDEFSVTYVYAYPPEATHPILWANEMLAIGGLVEH